MKSSLKSASHDLSQPISLTQGRSAPGGVYCEAASARRMHAPVIRSCRKAWMAAARFGRRRIDCLIRRISEDLRTEIEARLDRAWGRGLLSPFLTGLPYGCCLRLTPV